MKTFEEIAFDPAACRAQIKGFKKLLDTKDQLTERQDIQKFFKKSKQLSAFIGTFAPDVGPATHLAFEFPFMGDFSADIVLGNRQKGVYCIVELEDARSNSVFKKVANKSTTEWSPRFEHGFSQLVDWCYCLDDFKKTERFSRDFGHGYITFIPLLILGRNAGISEADRNRLKWRTEKVRVDSHSIECATLDDLYERLAWRISHYPAASKLEK